MFSYNIDEKNQFRARATVYVSLHILLIPGWVFSRDSSFLPHPKTVL